MSKYVTEANLTRYTAALKLNATVLDRNKPYVVGDIVQKGQVYLKCITAGTTATTALTLSSVINTVLTDGTVDWQVIDPFAETKIRDWESGVKYEVSRIVKYNGSLYRCLTTNMDATFTITNWELLVTGITDWASGEDYVVGQFVVYNGTLYECTTANNDNTFNSANWQKIAGGGLYTWAANTSYSVGDVVIYNNNIYQCNTAHTSGSTFNPDASKWTEISACITRIPNWQTSTDYVVGDLVAHDAKIYRCTTAHKSDSTQWNSTEEANWEELSPTINEISMWAVSTNYAVGQLVIHNNKLYRCNTAHTSDSTDFNTDIAYWNEIGASGIELWKVNEAYKQGSMVVYDNRIYVCDTAHTSANPFDPTKWHEISKNVIVDWQASIKYYEDQPIEYSDTLFRANKDFTSGLTVSNDDSNMDFVYANISPWKSGVYYRQGSIVVYSDNNIYKCIQSHTSGESIKPIYNTTSFNEVLSYNRPNGMPIPPLPDPQVLDLGVAKYVSHVYGLQAGGYAGLRNVNVYGSLDGTNYDFLYNFTDPNAREGTVFEADVSGYYRYIKLEVTEGWNDGGSHWSVSFTPFTIYTESEYWVRLDKTLIEKYAQAKDYPKNTPVIYKGKLYVANIDITNSSATLDPTKWDEVGGSGLDEWQPSTEYTLGNIVVKDNQIYKCTTAHTSDSSDFDSDIANWLLLDTKWKAENWVASKLYTANEVVLYDNRLFKCVSTHTSAVDFATDANYWKALSAKLEPWKASTYYTVGDTVINNNKLYKCIVAHTSDSTSISANLSNWEIVGSSGIDSWKANEDYTTSSVVIYNNKIYKCNASHTSGSTFDPTKWDEISSADIDLWKASTAYKVGNLVINNNQIYRCKTAHTSSSAFNSDIANWDILDTKWQAKDWVTNTYYLAGEVVIYDNTSYRCTTAHTSLGTFELDKGNWKPLNANIREWIGGTTYKVGDTVIYKNKIYKCVTANNDTKFLDNKWEDLCKCNIEMWRGASDGHTLALLHFDDTTDVYKNEFGNSFTPQASGEYTQVNTWSLGGDGYSISTESLGGILSPNYEFSTGNEVYTIEWWHYHEQDMASSSEAATVDVYTTYGNTKATKHTYLQNNAGIQLTIHGSPAYTFLSGVVYHVALIVSNAKIKVYINGNSVGEFFRPLNYAVYIFGNDTNKQARNNILIDELRVSDVNRYPTNFVPPKIPFTDPNYTGYKINDLVVYDDKIYRCIENNNDATFTPSKWVEVSPCVGIEEWSSGSDYTSGDVVIYNNNLYKVVNDVTVATDTPDVSNDYILLGGDSIKTWTGSKEYSAGTIVLHQNRLYRNANDIPSSVTTFSRDDWTPLSSVLEDWTSSKEYKVGDFVIRNDILYECITDNNDVTFNFAKWKPISKEGINAWQSNKQYALYDLVVEDEELYMCISPHTSSSDFQTDLDAERWKLIGGGGGSSGDWNQVTKMNVVAPLDVDINIPYTNTFKRPPVEVLKYEQGTTDITTNVLNFGVGDGSKFEVDGITAKDSPLITFDGVAKPNHDILYPFGIPIQMVNKYYSESEEIDLDDFKVVGEVSLE